MRPAAGGAPSATATDGLVVSSPWRQGAGRVHDPGPANLRAARQEHQVAARIRLAGDRELHKAHLIINVQGKVAGLLGLSLDDGTHS